MHWLVEVSHVGEETASERYCIDARRWQSALQEARRLRGDSGALPKLTIELLDHGYRAVDPALKVRYVVREAPADMPLTEGAQVSLTVRPPGVDSVMPVVDKLAATQPSVPPGRESVAPPRASTSVIPAQIIRNRDEQPAGDPIAYREIALSVRPGASVAEVEALLHARLEEAKNSMPAGAKRYVQIAVFDHMFVKRPVRPPLGTLMWKEWRGDPVLAFPGLGSPTDAPPPPLATDPPSTAARPAPSWLPPAMTNVALGATLPSTPPAAAKPAAPAASTAPAPVISVAPAAVAPAAVVPRADSIPPTKASIGSVKPAPVLSVGKSVPPKSAPPPAPEPEPPPPSGSRIDITEPPPPSGPEIDIIVESEPPSSGVTAALMEAEADRVAAAVAAAREAPTLLAAQMPPAPEEIVVPLTQRSEPPGEAMPVPLTRRSEPPPERPSPPPERAASDRPTRRSDPAAPRRRGPGDDLIGDLFERMHELAFMVDLISGADFLVQVLAELIPCEGIVVHAFDLARHEFVVVRARGPRAREALLFRTPDDDPLVHEIMRKRSIASNGAAPVRSGAFEKLGVETRFALCGAARQGGRYLGLVELANPMGDTPFHEGEVNAFEYVCEQFAEFVAQRPVVLEPDVVLGM